MGGALYGSVKDGRFLGIGKVPGEASFGALDEVVAQSDVYKGPAHHDLMPTTGSISIDRG